MLEAPTTVRYPFVRLLLERRLAWIPSHLRLFLSVDSVDSNTNGSYYYKNDNGSTYYNSGSGCSKYSSGKK
jgi:hypothetical protein